MTSDRRRALPSVDALLRAPLVRAAAPDTPRALLVAAARAAVAEARAQPATAPGDAAGWARAVQSQLATAAAPTLRRVINATGVVLHTNLGRAPLADAALAAIQATAGAYSALEYDVDKGARGSRHVHCTALLTQLTGAEDALVVNNAASALLLVLATAAEGGRVVVSRGELIEIGGGFRIPDILARSGAEMVEVGTTNRTRVSDYEKALGRARNGERVTGNRAAKSRLGPVTRHPLPVTLLKVHRSNFSLRGFTAEASLAELVALGRKQKATVVYDLGGGLMQDLGDAGLGGEPTLPAAARSGAQAVVASGDKLLGGPQAGIIVGRRRFLTACRAHPLARAVRADKLTLAALAATLHLYRDPAGARRAIPVLRMLTAPAADLEPVARALCDLLPEAANAEVISTRAAVGGGAFPDCELDSRGVALRPAGVSAMQLAERLRQAAVPVVALAQGGRVVLDVRTLLPGDAALVAGAVREALRA